MTKCVYRTLSLVGNPGPFVGKKIPRDECKLLQYMDPHFPLCIHRDSKNGECPLLNGVSKEGTSTERRG